MKNIPNILSFLRILLIPAFVWLMHTDQTMAAAIVLGISGITDMLDGFLARRFDWVTPLGKLLDPAADKLTQVAVCIVLAVRLRTYGPFFILLLLKEVIMLIGSAYLIKKQVKLEGAKWFGKLGTVLFYVSMTLIVFVPDMPGPVTAALLGATTACALLAAIMYIPEFSKYKEEIH